MLDWRGGGIGKRWVAKVYGGRAWMVEWYNVRKILGGLHSLDQGTAGRRTCVHLCRWRKNKRQWLESFLPHQETGI